MMTLRQIIEWATENGVSMDAEVLPLGAEIKYIGGYSGSAGKFSHHEYQSGRWYNLVLQDDGWQGI